MEVVFKETDDLRKYLEHSFGLLKSLSECRDELDEAVFETMVSRCEEMDRKLAHGQQAMQEMLNNSNQIDDAEKHFRTRMAELEANDPHDPIERYEELRHADTSIVIGHVTKDRKDPYTKQPIVKPLRNRHCGHVYDDAGLKAMVEQYKKTHQPLACPVAGCRNERVAESDVEPYPEFFDDLDDPDILN